MFYLIIEKLGVESGTKYFNSIKNNDKIRKQPPFVKDIPETDSNHMTRMHYLLDKMIKTVNMNMNRKPGGYRYDKEMQMISSYIRIFSGLLLYETSHSNLSLAIPSLPSTNNRYIARTNYRNTEGVLKSRELMNYYLNECKSPLVVSLSEDATRISGRIQYDSINTNQIIGFVPPINKMNGMPMPFAFKAILNDFINY